MCKNKNHQSTSGCVLRARCDLRHSNQPEPTQQPAWKLTTVTRGKPLGRLENYASPRSKKLYIAQLTS